MHKMLDDLYTGKWDFDYKKWAGKYILKTAILI